MAKYRQVHTTFWDDSFVLDLTPEEKYFYLYLMTNGKTTQCGIYELPYRVIEMHTGYNRETVGKLLDRFIEYGKIAYNEGTKEIMALNWAKYNFINSPKVKKCIEKELAAVKFKPFVDAYITQIEQLGYRIDTVSIHHDKPNEPKVPEASNGKGSIPYQHPMDSPSIDLGEEEEKEEETEEEKEREQEEEPSSLSSEIFKFYESEFGPLTPFISEEIEYMIKDCNEELALEALKKSVLANKRSIKYASAITRNWKNENIKTLADLQANENMKGREQHGINQSSSIQKNVADDEQRRIREEVERRSRLLHRETGNSN